MTRLQARLDKLFELFCVMIRTATCKQHAAITDTLYVGCRGRLEQSCVE